MSSKTSSRSCLGMACTWCEQILCTYTDVCKNFSCLGRCTNYDFSMGWDDGNSAEKGEDDIEYEANLCVSPLGTTRGGFETPPTPYSLQCCDVYPISGWTYFDEADLGEIDESFSEQSMKCCQPKEEDMVFRDKSPLASMPLSPLDEFPLYPHLPPFKRPMLQHGKASFSWPLGKITVYEGKPEVVMDKPGKVKFVVRKDAKEEAIALCSKMIKKAHRARYRKTPSFTHRKKHGISGHTTPPLFAGSHHSSAQSQERTQSMQRSKHRACRGANTEHAEEQTRE